MRRRPFSLPIERGVAGALVQERDDVFVERVDRGAVLLEFVGHAAPSAGQIAHREHAVDSGELVDDTLLTGLSTSTSV